MICPFVDKETNGSYLFLNGLNGLAHLCSFECLKVCSLCLKIVRMLLVMYNLQKKSPTAANPADGEIVFIKETHTDA